ncbi:MAG: hypothetical protein OEQ39_05680 [Gammaproteobacteria bacterium]|nr:hypothetical protein [Gammaproteobacteria bacterium]
MKLVINRCFGGFGLSAKALECLVEKKSETVSFIKNYGWIYEDEFKYRSHPDLINIVKNMGAEANGAHAELEIIEVPDDVECIELHDYDGMESVHECHQSWG